MRIAYGDLIGGVSGDMFVGALLDVGLPLERLKSELKKLPGLNYRLEVTKKPFTGFARLAFGWFALKENPSGRGKRFET